MEDKRNMTEETENLPVNERVIQLYHTKETFWKRLEYIRRSENNLKRISRAGRRLG